MNTNRYRCALIAAIFAAGLAQTTQLSGVSYAQDGQELTDDEIVAVMSGRSFEGKNDAGEDVYTTYHEGGGLTFAKRKDVGGFKKLLKFKGTWEAQNGELCRAINFGGTEKTQCMVLIRRGKQVDVIDEDGSRLTSFEAPN